MSAPATAAEALEPGELAVSFDPDEHLGYFEALQGQIFDFYIITFEPPGDLGGFEFGLQFAPDLIVTPPPSPSAGSRLALPKPHRPCSRHSRWEAWVFRWER